MGKYEVKNEPGKTFTQDYDITGFGPDFTIVVADYAAMRRKSMSPSTSAQWPTRSLPCRS